MLVSHFLIITPCFCCASGQEMVLLLHWLEKEVLYLRRHRMTEEHLDYWKRRLDGATDILQLPTDHARPALQTFRGARQSCLLSRALTEQIEVLSQQKEATPFMVL